MTTISIPHESSRVNTFNTLSFYWQSVYELLWRLSRKKSFAYCSNSWLTTKYKVCLSRVEEILMKLERWGLIHRERNFREHNRRIYCMYDPYQKQEVTPVCKGSLPLSNRDTDTDPLPYIEKREESTNSVTTTPMPLPVHLPLSPVVVPSLCDSVSDEKTTELRQDELTGNTGELPTAELSSPTPTTNHPQEDAAALSVASNLTAVGISKPVSERLVSKYGPDACRLQLSHFNPAKHDTGWLVDAITKGYKHTEKRQERSTVLKMDKQTYLQAGVVKIVGQDVPPPKTNRKASNRHTDNGQKVSPVSEGSNGIDALFGALKFRRKRRQ